MRRVLLAGLLCGVLIPVSGYPAPRPACLNDAKKFCASVIQDEEARKRCMREHSSELSDGCRAAIATGARGDPAKLEQCTQRCAQQAVGARAVTSCQQYCRTGTSAR